MSQWRSLTARGLGLRKLARPVPSVPQKWWLLRDPLLLRHLAYFHWNAERRARLASEHFVAASRQELYWYGLLDRMHEENYRNIVAATSDLQLMAAVNLAWNQAERMSKR